MNEAIGYNPDVLKKSTREIVANVAAGAKVARVLTRRVMAPLVRRGDAGKGQEEGILLTLLRGKPSTRRSRFVSAILKNL